MGLSLAGLKALTEELVATIQSFQEYAEKVIAPFNAKYQDITQIPLRERAIHNIDSIVEEISFLYSMTPWPQDFFVLVTQDSISSMPFQPGREETAVANMRYLPFQGFLSIAWNVKAAMELGGLDSYLKHEPFRPPNMARLLYDAIPPYGKVAAYVSNPHYKADNPTSQEDRSATRPASAKEGTETDQNQDREGNTESTV